MAIIDFKEIPEAHLGSGEQDSFEQFAAEFLELLGLTIIEWPSRGADGGKDSIAEETRTGIMGKTRIRHLVSCKHKAFSGKSVTPADESNVADRVRAAGCNGFIGVYSTIPSTALVNIIKNLGFEAKWFDSKRIERELLVPDGLKLAKRYFPASIAAWGNENPAPVPVFGQLRTVDCDICGRNLLDPIRLRSFLGGVLIYCIRQDEIDQDEPHIVDVRWHCKVRCMGAMEKRLRKEGLQEEGWDDIHDFMHPARFIALLLHNFDLVRKMMPNACEKYSHMLACTFQYVARQMTEHEIEIYGRMKELGMIL